MTAVSLVALPLLPPIPQDQSYHQFADGRTLSAIPNFWNVISNLPFIAVGAVGLLRCRDDPTAIVLFLGIFLIGFGSSYYHWAPSDESLVLGPAAHGDCLDGALPRRLGVIAGLTRVPE